MLGLAFAGHVASETIDFGKFTCPVEGPKFARPRNLAKSPLIQRALKNATDQLELARNGTIKGGWLKTNSSFSIALVNIDDKKPFWEYHFRGTNNNPNSTKHVDGDSQYLVGSMSKLVTILTLLKSGIDMYKPITHYVPEIDYPDAKVQWRKITLHMLANHLGGIPANCMSSKILEARLYH